MLRMKRSAPLIANIQITGKCNLRCGFCFYHSPLVKKVVCTNHMPVTKLKEIIGDLSFLGVKKIVLCGSGEPSLHPDFLKIVKDVKDRGISLVLVTNLTQSSISSRSAYALADSVILNLSAVDAVSYAAIHGAAPRNFRKVVDNIVYLRKCQELKGVPQLQISYVITKDNFHYIKRVIDLAAVYKVDSIYFRNMNVTRDTRPVAMRLSQRRDFIKEISALIAYATRVGVQTNLAAVRRELLLPNGVVEMFRHCFIPRTYVTFDSNGDIGLCPQNKRLHIGKWARDRLPDIWSGKRAEACRKMARDHFDNQAIFGVRCTQCAYAAVNVRLEASYLRCAAIGKLADN